jgi:shikimate dehydrogenase
MRTTHKTKLIGVLAHPAGENLQHEILSRAAEITGADVAFLLFDSQAKDLPTPVAGLQTLGASGIYLTGRLRVPGSGLVDFLTDEAHGAGVVNTIIFDGDQSTGHNTEARAIIAALEPHKDRFTNGGVVILGGGAMARAAAYAVIRHYRAKYIALADRTMQQAQVLKQEFAGKKQNAKIEAYELFPPDMSDVLAEARLIINATAIGVSPNVAETPITLPDIFHNRQIVLDTIYTPAETRMLSEAAAGGATVIDGNEILLRQMGFAFELLTGMEFPTEEIRKMLAGEGEKEETATGGEGEAVTGEEREGASA